ncbi:DinB family protein [Thiomicrorhabdus sp. 6S3-12]|uniref:DinB family protein n=1 Tax=Thiomicrorhabdus sp. 6S3-12 TaxID=2819681 RepID=UPI001AAD5D70|nr:DinB family protein [Thiomicrorhabdus sp. 6S3-12]MBO1924228.1 DinB family protein [Thiomicrorhabdus sp. 6S3-12]
MSQLNEFALQADYNRLMNQRQYEACANLSAAQLKQDQGAFFKSILGTLNHILVGDIIWLKRFGAHPSSQKALAYVNQLAKPASLDSCLFADLSKLHKERKKIDAVIIDWIGNLDEEAMRECISYTNMAGERFSKPLPCLITHLFLHQVHHRGQVTTLLSQCGVDFGETDLIELIAEC